MLITKTLCAYVIVTLVEQFCINFTQILEKLIPAGMLKYRIKKENLSPFEI